MQQIIFFQGTLLKHLEEHVIQSNMARDDVFFYYTTVSEELYHPVCRENQSNQMEIQKVKIGTSFTS